MMAKTFLFQAFIFLLVFLLDHLVFSLNCSDKNDEVVVCNKVAAQCFAVRNTVERLTIDDKGCSYPESKDCNRKTCILRTLDNQPLVSNCCCNTHMCNAMLYVDDKRNRNETKIDDVHPEPVIVKAVQVLVKNLEGNVHRIYYVCLVLLLLAGLASATYYLYKRRSTKPSKFIHYDNPLNTIVEVNECDKLFPKQPALSDLHLNSCCLENSSLQHELLRLLSKGRFGEVWLARNVAVGRLVAIKRYSTMAEDMWLVEAKVYRLPNFSRHPNLLKFLGAEKISSPTNEFLLITEYEMRSLQDYLKVSTVDWREVLKIAGGIAAGLTFLHEEGEAEAPSGPRKPPVAHRDLKTSNVMLKADLTPCISDFNLALILDGAKVFNQVGTTRYMAPELLDGAIPLCFDSFLRSDIYSCGLVFWEIVCRCSIGDEPVAEYRLPYEVEVGLNPSLDMLHQLVAVDKRRPILNEKLPPDSEITELCDVIRECWDDDAEARPTACCILYRINDIVEGGISN